MAKPLVSASYDKSWFLVMHDPDAHPLESLARGKSREIQCQFIILARKDELTPDFPLLARKDELTPDFPPVKNDFV